MGRDKKPVCLFIVHFFGSFGHAWLYWLLGFGLIWPVKFWAAFFYRATVSIFNKELLYTRIVNTRNLNTWRYSIRMIS
jgi:hypothetical protein